MKKYHIKLPTTLEQEVQANQNLLMSLIRSRLGIIIHQHQMMELSKIILDGCRLFNCNLHDYLQKMEKEPIESALIEHLIAGITVNETYFFRDKQQMDLLQYHLLPELIQTKREQKDLCLRIWSAGCATGEEIYTIGMMLVELLSDLKNWRLQLLGTDLNTRSLQKAMMGKYTQWSMRSISNYYKHHYFMHTEKHYQLHTNIRDMVNFAYLNLNDDTFPSLLNNTNAQDLILCRNVLIYLDHDGIPHLMKKLSHCLTDGGYLLLGASDPIQTAGTPLIYHHSPGTLLVRSSTKTQAVVVEKIKHPLPKPISPTPKPTASSPKQVPIKENSTLLNAKAMTYANLGHLKQSLDVCMESIATDPTNKDAYFTFALTLVELNRLEEAEEAFRKTLFLDRHFVAGHFQLGLLLLKKGHHEMGIKSLTNALTIALAKNADDLVPGYQGLTYGKLSEIFKHEIELYGAPPL